MASENEKREAVGNAAAMREALVKCREIALQWQADEADGVAGTTDKPQARSAAEAVIDMEFEINAALSAPARNCDIYTTSKDADRAITEYCSKMAETGECVKSCPHREAEGGCAFGWLLAAAERKGEGK